MAESSVAEETNTLIKRRSTAADSTSVTTGVTAKDTNCKIIVDDASSSSRDRDAPGQNCTYIPPGDHRTEFYRLGTYAKFPKQVPVKQTDMAAAGFYWTGYNDRVKCFSCGMTVENWTLGDDGMDDQWHKSTCRMVAGQDRLNVPIPEPNFRSLFRRYRADPHSTIITWHSVQSPMDISDEMQKIRLNGPPKIVFANIVDPDHETMLRNAKLWNELERRKTFAKWPSYPSPYLVSDLAKEGFFYLGNLDRTQCFCCSGVLRNWAPNDIVSEQHQKHFSHCRINRGEFTGNVPISELERSEMDRQYREKLDHLLANNGEPSDPTPEEQRQLAERFPCLEPVNPHMNSMARRTATFDSRWPRQKVRASIEQIAKAGFFFLGDSDKTKCFYCNGGLQNWDYNDEPWTEHAKWFPGCEFVLRMKGIDFVRRLKDAHPNLNRPFIRNPVSLDVPPSEVRRTSRNSNMEVAAPERNINITELQSMGFSREQIDRAMTRRGNTRYNTEDIVQDLLEQSPIEQAAPTPTTIHQPASIIQQQPIVGNAGNKREAVPENVVINKKTRTSSPESLVKGSEMADSLREMEEAVLCRKCKKNRSEMTMIPCGHLCLCEGCAVDVKRCFICKGRVTEKIKVYRA